MELEEMKSLWQQMSQKLEKQQLVTDKLIMEMTQQKYSNRFNKLFFYESLGSVICVITAVLIFANIERLDTWYLMACGIAVAVILLILPFFTLRFLHQIKNIKVAEYNYKETLVRFQRSKNRMLMYQRGGIILSFFLALMILPVFQKIFQEEDFFKQGLGIRVWVSVGVMLVFLFFFARWGYRSYKSVTRSAESVLKELEDNGQAQ